MLDEELRGRVHHLAELDEPSLDGAAQERILSVIREQGPGIVRGARRRRVAAALVAFAAAAAAVAALFAVRHGSEATSAKVEGTPGTAPLCASREVPASAKDGFITGSNGARLDLGAVALATSTPGTSVRLEEASSCRTVIALDSGTVAVHAKDLGGGELRVHTDRGDVVVHGTLFAVTRDASSLAVEVVVGNVSVTDSNDSHSVTTGQRLLLSAVGAAEGPLEAGRARALRAALGVPEASADEEANAPPVPPRTEPALAPPAQPAAPTAGAGAPRVASSPIARAEEPAKTALPVPEVTLEAEEPTPAAPPKADKPPQDPLALAEEARRAGDYAQARELYRRAAEGTGVTAEAAWVALARMELALGHATAAREATKQRQERFGRGTLSPEALWIDVRSYRQSGDVSKARDLATQLVDQWPSSPQARAAAQWLGAR
ncbi:MAG TPA: FecR domain-containing protein [Polyangiaceae bacterium]|nr:FecR domain-containing protein [Polyangiaceae bacterium]